MTLVHGGRCHNVARSQLKNKGAKTARKHEPQQVRAHNNCSAAGTAAARTTAHRRPRATSPWSSWRLWGPRCPGCASCRRQEKGGKKEARRGGRSRGLAGGGRGGGLRKRKKKGGKGDICCRGQAPQRHTHAPDTPMDRGNASSDTSTLPLCKWPPIDGTPARRSALSASKIWRPNFAMLGACMGSAWSYMREGVKWVRAGARGFMVAQCVGAHALTSL